MWHWRTADLESTEGTQRRVLPRCLGSIEEPTYPPGELIEVGGWFSCWPEASRLGVFVATGEGGSALRRAVRTPSTGISPAWAGAVTSAPSVCMTQGDNRITHARLDFNGRLGGGR